METAAVIPKRVAGVLRRLTDAGFEACAVGGCVRDAVMGRRPHDWDAASSARPEEVRRLFRHTVPTGVRYGTVTVFSGGGRCEVTTFRTDGPYRNGRSPERVSFVSGIREDLARRDFTMNAMALSADGELTDPFGGRADIAARLIRCVGEPEARFSEDALRMFRALRFSAQLGFTPEPRTAAAIGRCAPLAAGLSAERVRDELGKILASDRPWIAGEVIEYGLMSKLIHLMDGKKPENLEKLALLPKRGPYRWCALAASLLDCGAAEDAGALLASLRLDAGTVRACREALEPGAALPAENGALRLCLAERGAEAALMEAAAGTVRGDTGAWRRVRGAVRRGGYVPVAALAVTGDDLKAAGLRGREIGAALTRLSRAATLGRVANERAALLRLAEER